MIIRIERGKIRISFHDLSPEQGLLAQNQLKGAIGTFKIEQVGSTDDYEGVCDLGVQNLRKLRQMGARLEQDEVTKLAVAALREELNVYEYETELVRHIKAGKPCGTPAAMQYQFKIPPFAHQRVGFHFLHAVRYGAVFGGCGTGKTCLTSTAIDSLVKHDGPWFALVVCPVNLIKHAWLEDIAKFTDLRAASLRTTGLKEARERKYRELLAGDHDVWVINPENLRVLKSKRKKGDKVSDLINAIKARKKAGAKFFLVIDESTMLKSRQSITFKVLNELRTHADKAAILTGTPSPNGILDLWPQFHFLDRGLTLYSNFNDYRAEFAQEIPLKGVTWVDGAGRTQMATKWAPKRASAKIIHNLIEPRSVRFRTEDCIDLPPQRFLVREVEMNEAQQKAYAEMEAFLFTEVEDETATARVAVAKLNKLRQITGGFVMDDAGAEQPLGKDSPKALELDLMLEQSIEEELGQDSLPAKAIIWTQYQWESKKLLERYRKKYKARGLFGGISEKERDDAVTSFRRDRDCRVLVAHPASAGRGLTLVEANYVFYYSLSYNYEEFYQSYRRVTRPGQTRSMTFYSLICPGTIDEALLTALNQKQNVADVVTDGKRLRQIISRETDRPRLTMEAPNDQDPTGGDRQANPP